MADIALTLCPSGRYDFLVQNGTVVYTDDVTPAALRQLIQAPWTGDDGERDGDALPDIKFLTTETRAQVQEIVERRLGRLVRLGMLESASLLDLQTEGDRLWVFVEIRRPGKPPEALQVPLLR